MLPLSLFKVRNIASASGVSFLRGLMLLAVVSYIPLFVQAGLGLSINTSSEILDAFLLPMIVGSVLGGTLVTRLSYRTLTVAGLVLATIGAYALTMFDATRGDCPDHGVRGPHRVRRRDDLLGHLPRDSELRARWKQIGVASSLPQFMGNLGGTIGLAILGTIQVNTFASKVAGVLARGPASVPAARHAVPGQREPGRPDTRVAAGAAAALLAQYPALTASDTPAQGRLRGLDQPALHRGR